MNKVQITIRVRYVETDRMGIAHHTHYFSWMEQARTELMRQNGLSYRDLEERGYMLPVREAHCRYRHALSYDDEVKIQAELLEIGGASLKIGYRLYGKDTGMPAAEGYTVHPFTDKNGKIVKVPRFFSALFQDGKK
ncbi:MAG: acyl-CoA thioesterase [Spirochaetes bacterium]|nr:acyl-CoA thioesterase [Spirochaetota bacterium]